ncbi:MAG: nucleotidyltransferase domain-containing protein [Pseudomonadota bacterium]
METGTPDGDAAMQATAEAVAPEWRARIDTALEAIAHEEDVTLLLAVESGSRAWGFHSPDSDYDVRFIYARPVDWHLSIEPGRDMIERPISDLLDLSGWDLRKTLGLMLRSNAVALEWLQSPIRYAAAPGFAEDLSRFAARVLQRRPITWHYLCLTKRQREGLDDEAGRVRLKRYFYTIRPALALRWLRLNPEDRMLPMCMAALVAGTNLSTEETAALDRLTEAKRAAVEKASMDETPAVLDALIAHEIAEAERYVASAEPRRDTRDIAAADALHRDWTHRVDHGRMWGPRHER